MSLNRIASLETFLSAGEHEGQQPRPRRDSGVSVAAADRARKITFNPLPESWDPVFEDEPIETVGAFDVARRTRILQVVVTVIYCLFAAGVVFGYAALKPVLKQEGAYRDQCDGDDTCIEIHLNLMFTVAAVATNVAALPVGAILDHFGPRVCGCLGALFLTAGSLILAFAMRVPFDGFLIGYLLLALGGPFTYISSFQLSNAFPRHSGFILALLTGAFDASSALFLVYRLVFEHTQGSFGHSKFFLAYLVVPLVIVVLQFTILPAQSYKTVGEMIDEIEGPVISKAPDSEINVLEVPIDDEDDINVDQVDEQTALLREERREHRVHVIEGIEEVLGDSAVVDEQIEREGVKQERSGVWGIMHNATVWQQLRSPWWILICLFTVIQMTRINYFVATIRAQYTALLGSPDLAAHVNTFFDVALPLGGLVSIPFVGTILDRFSTLTVLATLVTVATTIGVLGIIGNLGAAYANILLFVLYRPFYYTAVSDYTAKVFGFRTFGTVYGTIICLSGLLNFSQSGLDYMFHEVCGGDPVPVNLGLLGLGVVVGAALVLYVGISLRKMKSKESARAAAFGETA